MATPSMEAFNCAMHMIAYLDGQRHRGIRFRSDATGEPICYYDSSDKKDPKDSKAQYGYVIMMFGGPILWSVKKHNHAGRSSTDNEYMRRSTRTCLQIKTVSQNSHNFIISRKICHSATKWSSVPRMR